MRPERKANLHSFICLRGEVPNQAVTKFTAIYCMKTVLKFLYKLCCKFHERQHEAFTNRYRLHRTRITVAQDCIVNEL